MSLGFRKAIVALSLGLFLAPSLVSAATFERPLEKGMSGPDVSALQQILKEKGFYTHPEITGYYGQVTLQAVADFQRSVGLDHLGYVGPATRAILNGEVIPSNGSSSGSSMLSTLITSLQQLLRDAGFSGVELTGTLDSATLQAAQSVASGEGLPSERSGGGGSRSRADDEDVDTASPAISAIVSSPSQTSVTITWNTDEDADSRVDLGTTTAYGTASTSATLSTSHSLAFTGLAPATTYHFRIQSTDASSNVATSSDQTFTTSAVPDITAPVVSAIASSTGMTTATISWTTDEAATSVVNYGLTASYGSASTTAALSTSHSIALTGLTASTTYHFQVRSVDAAGNIATSSDRTFVTAVPAQVGLSMTQLPANRIFQRLTTTGSTNGKGAGSITVPVTLTSSASLIEYRLRDAVTGGNPVLQDWTTAATNIAQTATTTTIANVPVRLGWYYLDLRANGDDTQIQLGTNRVAVGRIVAVSGQSLAVRMFGKMDSQTASNASLGVTPSQYSSVYATYTDGQRSTSTPVWTVPADGTFYDSTYASEFLRLEVAASGVPTALIGHARGAQLISVFLPGGSENTPLRQVLDNAGGFETFLWMQGHSDSANGTSNATYQSSLTTLFTDMTAHNAVRGSNYTKILATIPNINSGWGTPATITTIRNAASTWASNNGATYIQPNDLDLVDGVHQSQLGSIALARHFYRATRPEFGLSGSDLGPTITSATRSTGSRDIVLTVSLPSGATSLVASGTPASRFKVFATGTTASALTLDSGTPITIASSTITLKLAADPGDSAALDVYAYYPHEGANQGQANNVYDNHTDGDGLIVGRQLTATLSPVTAAAPNPGADTTPPVISSISSGTPGANSATITWTTNENSDSLVDFGTTASYGSASTTAALSTSHSITLTGLASSTTYHYRVQSVDASSNVATSSDQTFTTSSGGSSQVGANLAMMASPTYVSGKSGFGQEIASGYGVTSTTTDNMPAGSSWSIEGIVMATSAPASVKVAFGQSEKAWIGIAPDGRIIGNYRTNVGSDTYINGTLPAGGGTNPTIADGLRHHVALVSSSTGASLFLDGQLIGSGTSTPKTGYGISVYGVHSFGGGAPSYVWPGTVDEVAIWNTVRYSGTFAVPTTPYTGNESGLTSLWHLDGNGNAASTSGGSDTTAPVISSISSGTPTQTSATITWNTDEASDSLVDLGTTTAYGTASTTATLSTSHSLTFTGLATSTTYHYRIRSADASSNVATSSDQTFTTAAPDTTAPIISSIASSTATSSASITWTTNEAANSQVEYGTTTSYGTLTTLDSSLVTSHTVPIMGLATSTTYHFRIRTSDASGNLATSSDQTFTTTAESSTQVGVNLSMTTPTYASGKSGFGQEMTQGYGLTSTTGDSISSGQTWTIEGIISATTSPASVRVAFGQGQKAWIGLAQDGRIIGNYINVNGTDVWINNTFAGGGGTNPIITDGTRRHVALVATPSLVSLFVDGSFVGSSTSTPRGTLGNTVFGVHSFGGTPATYVWPGTVDEVGIWNTARYSSGFTPSATPYTGNESGLTSLWHLDGNGNAATY